MKYYFNSKGTQYIQFQNVEILSNRDFSFDFWFMTSDSNYGRIWDFGRAETVISYMATNQRTYLYYEPERYIEYTRGQWNHLLYQYDSDKQCISLYINGILKAMEFDQIILTPDLFYLAKSTWGADPIANIKYTGIRIQYNILFKPPELTPWGLKYVNSLHSNISTN